VAASNNRDHALPGIIPGIKNTCLDELSGTRLKTTVLELKISFYVLHKCHKYSTGNAGLYQ